MQTSMGARQWKRLTEFVPILSITLLICTLFNLSLLSQATAAITGFVKDPSGGLVPGTTIIVTSLATGSTRAVLASETGNYRITNLIPGRYEVAASIEGFKRSVTQVEVTVGQVVHVELALEIGSISQEVTVSNAAAAVELEQARVSSLVDHERILDLPLNGRNVYQLMQLTPGAVNTTSTVFEPGQNTNINGGRANMNGFWMDGITTRGLSGGTGYNFSVPGAQPNLEAIQEFRIETLNFSAEFGDSAASVVNVVSRSGSNDFHGSVYWFHRNDKLDAREFFDEERPPYRQNQFGFSLGGPLIKDKTFFFGSYEGTRIRTGESRTEVFESRAWADYAAAYGRPTSRYLYSSFKAPELDSFRTSVGGYLAGDNPWRIPYIPSPDQASVDAFLGWTFGSMPGSISADAPMIGEASFFTRESNDSDGLSLRLDQELGENDKIYGRYFFNNTDSDEIYERSSFHDPSLGKSHLLALNWTHVFTASLVNEARVGFNRTIDDFFWRGGVVDGAPGLPWIGESSFHSVFAAGVPWNTRQNTFSGADTLSIVRGNHGLKTGVEVRRNREYGEFDAGRPAYYFVDLIYLALDDPYYQIGGVDPNLQEGFGQAELASNYRDWRGTEIGLFFNDDWKVLSNVTLNLGVRWDWFGRLTEAQDLTTAFDMSLGSDVFERVYNGGFVGPVERLSENDWNNVAPRIGFAWDPFSDGRMSIRSGYGISYQGLIFEPLSTSRWNKPFYSANLVAPLFGIGSRILYGPQDGSPVRVDGPNPNPGASQYKGNIIGYDPANPNIGLVTAIPNPRMQDPYVQSFFVGVQRELGRDLTVEANYVGTLGRKLLRAEDFNRYSGDLLGLPNPVSGENAGDPGLNRINAREGVLRFWENSVSSNYHALQLQVNQRYSNGIALNANYTFAKSLDTRSSWHSGERTSNRYQEGYATDVSIQKLDYGRSIFDARHRFTLNWLWDSNWFESANSWLLRNVVGGWQYNGIVALQSGQPFTPYSRVRFGLGGDWNADGSRNDRPNTPAVGNSISSERSDFTNPNAGIFNIPSSTPNQPPGFVDKLQYFGEPELGTNGNLGRNTYEGPGFASVDFSLFRDFALNRLSEDTRIQFRVEFFNLFNRVNLFQPAPELQNPVFGRSVEAFDAREIQLGLKVIF
jgi:hypothetical protein